MRYVSEFRSQPDTENLVRRIQAVARGLRPVILMEVCGSHTMAIHRFGLRRLLPPEVRLISGPGCPVCVTGVGYLDRAVAMAVLPEVTVTTFGDMVRVPGSRTTLARARAAGADIRVVSSTMEAVRLARENPARRVVFLGVGFETTSPTVAASVKQAKAENLRNYFVLVGHKLIPPAMRLLAQAPELRVDGFLCPAHVSAVIGTEPYRFLAEDHGKACVIAGFEPLDILRGVEMLLRQIALAKPRVENEYARVVRPAGNPAALRLLEECFTIADDTWRGFGLLPGSGYVLSPAWRAFDAAEHLPVDPGPAVEPAGCRCGDVLRGLADPPECPLYGAACTPESPVGACMVSSEGTCAAWNRHAGLGEG